MTRTRLWVDAVDITETADADQLGLPGSMLARSDAASGPTMIRLPKMGQPKEFQTATLDGGSRIVTQLYKKVGGWFGVPKGPESTHERVKGARPQNAEQPRPLTEVTYVPSAPPYEASYESYLSQYR